MTFEEVLDTEKKQHPADKRPVVGWLCSYTPEEIIEAAGFRPFRILPGPEPAPSADSCVTGNLCSRVKNCLGYALTGRYVFMKGMVTVFSCNAMTHMYNIWKEYVRDIFIYSLEVPAHQEREAGDYMEEQLAAMFATLAHKAGVEPDYNALHDAVSARLETMRLLGRMQSLRMMKNPPVKGTEAARIVEMASTVPRNVFNPALRSYLSAVERDKQVERIERAQQCARVGRAGLVERVERDEQGRLYSGARILITGGLIPRFLVEMEEECGGLVVVEDGCNGYRYFAGTVKATGNEKLSAGKAAESEEFFAGSASGTYAANKEEIHDAKIQERERKLLRCLANCYLKRPPCSRMYGATEQRSREMGRLAAQYRVEGIIHYSLKFCDCNIYDYPVLRDKAAELGIPFLRLEGEEHGTGTGQLKTRLQAFLEMVRG